MSELVIKGTFLAVAITAEVAWIWLLGTGISLLVVNP
jgi:hypothetical protein